MNTILICPDRRDVASFARRMKPLALLPFAGRSLLDLWLEKLARDGVQHVTILAADRPEQIRQATGLGGRWGLHTTVIPVMEEPSQDVPHLLMQREPSIPIITLDSLPALPSIPLWESTEGLFHCMLIQFKHLGPESLLTMRQVAPDIFVSSRARIASSAVIDGPAWIGPDVVIGPGAHIMPGSIIEEAAYIDQQATIRGSWIGPKTYVGAMTEITHSFAWGRGLENWRLASFIEITDDFLLSSLKHKTPRAARSSWPARILALLLMLTTLPLALLYIAWTRMNGQSPVLIQSQVILPPPGLEERYTSTIRLQSLNGIDGLFARWPQLWSVWQGDLHLVGNRPLSPSQAAQLGDEFEQLWLSSPAGVFSLADALEDGSADHETNLAHAACYSVSSYFRMKLHILLRCLPRFLFSNRPSEPNALIQPTPNPKTTCNA